MKQSILVLSIILLAGCGRFLDVQPQGYVIPKTDEEFASIMHSIIREVEGGGDEFIVGNMEKLIRLEGCADDLDANVRIGNQLPSYAGEIINSMQLKYSNIWKTVKDCNIVIENLDGRSSDTARGALSAAYAIKGILYYNMIRDYCEPWEGCEGQKGLPIVDEFDISAAPVRSDLKVTAAYTLDLLNKALDLDPQDELFFFTEWIVKAYKAKLLFWIEDWNGTISVCKDIIEHSGYELTPWGEYASMINSANDKKGEVIVRSHINNSSELDWYFSMVKKYVSTRPAALSLIRLYGDEPNNDIRYVCSLDSKRMNTKTVEAKVRLSEIVLMLSESLYHTGAESQALDYINGLRANRIKGAVAYTASNLPAVRSGERIVEDAEGNPITPLLQVILDERRKELFVEGDRWYELKRNGRPEWWILSNGLKYTTRKYLYTAPIYKKDVELNENMIQNEGY